MSRGNAGGNVFLADANRHAFLELFEERLTRYDMICYAFCLMDNHYHLLIETPKANLSQLMRERIVSVIAFCKIGRTMQ